MAEWKCTIVKKSVEKPIKVILIAMVLQPKKSFCFLSLRQFWFMWESWQKFVLFWRVSYTEHWKTYFWLCDHSAVWL